MGFDEEFVEDIFGFGLHEAGGCPIAAAIVFFGGYTLVEDDLNPLTFIEQDAEDGGRSDRGAKHAFKEGHRCKGNAGAATLL